MYWPILGIPLHADDFYNYAFWAELRALPTAPWWVNLDPVVLFQGEGWARGRAAPTGFAVFYLWQETSFRVADLLGIAPDLVQRLWRLIFPVLGVASLSAFLVAWRLVPLGGRALGHAGGNPLAVPRSRAFSEAFLASALLLAVTTQVHLLWSNEPLTAFNLAGWITPILMLLFLAASAPALRWEARPSWVWVLLAFGIGVAGAWFYELFLLAPLLLAVLVVVNVCESLARRRWLRAAGIAAVGSLLSLGPMLAFAVIRLGAPQGLAGSGAYEGTAISLGTNFVTTWRAAALSSLPAAAWEQTRRTIGAFWGTTYLSLNAVLTTILLVTLCVLLLRRMRPAKRPEGGTDSKKSRFEIWGGAGGFFLLAGLWIGSAGVHSMTTKYQEELGATVGKVYLFYSPGLLAISGMLGVGLLALASLRSSFPLYVALVLMGIFATQQFAANSELARVGTATYAGEQAAIDALRNPARTSAGDRMRCEGLETWRETGRWQQADEERHFQDAFRLTHGFPLCSEDPP